MLKINSIILCLLCASCGQWFTNDPVNYSSIDGRIKLYQFVDESGETLTLAGIESSSDKNISILTNNWKFENNQKYHIMKNKHVLIKGRETLILKHEIIINSKSYSINPTKNFTLIDVMKVKVAK